MGGAHRAPGGASGRGLGVGRSRRPLSAAAAIVAERPATARAIAIQGARRGTPEYPAALLDLRDPPANVYVRGAAVPAPGRCVAIVGSRAASPYGSAMATRLARDLAGLGLTIVSGLARGIDAAAHRGALAAGGRTIAVVPSGLDRVTPPSHDPLADEVVRAGTLLSEIASGPPFGRGAFVRRNRLIAALAAVTVVVEASERSGALVTAAVARELGRNLAAVPGDVDRPTVRGVLELLRSGARVCADAGDVLALLPAVPAREDAGDAAP
ncbi:MAG TPA: DNA-processing protein DprA, partial [Candidatus Acidoferrales bacterium]|nr:DNA-processing protein DprA [Candidatus Acidoferrales bacterium]